MNQSIRILLVDDDEVDRRICRRALARFDPPPRFVEVETAEQALSCLRQQEFDCVLLDYRLPDMDGLDLLRRIAERPPEERVPVVMLTGADDVSIAVEAMRSGAIDYLVKDVEGRFQALIPTVVERSMRKRELNLARWRAEQALAQHRLELSDLTRRLMVQEKTMVRRLAQALHDQLGQTLTALRLGFDALTVVRREPTTLELERRTRLVDTLIDQAVHEVRQVLVELRPPLLEEHGLAAALDNELRTRALVHDEVDLRLEPQADAGERRWPADVEYAAFMIAREAIANALRHSQAGSIRVALRGDAASMALEIADDGNGMTPDRPAASPGHLGMVGMRERALAIGGRYSVESSPGVGTRVRLEWRDTTASEVGA